jgi:hypothetical protein
MSAILLSSPNAAQTEHARSALLIKPPMETSVYLQYDIVNLILALQHFKDRDILTGRWSPVERFFLFKNGK